MAGKVLGRSVPRLLQRPLEDEKATAPRLGDIERLLSLLLLLLSLSLNRLLEPCLLLDQPTESLGYRTKDEDAVLNIQC